MPSCCMEARNARNGAGGPKQQRFRSALEQVSYLTNESAMRSTDASRW